MKLILALTFALLIPTYVFSQAKNNVSSLASNDEQELRALVKKWNEAESEGDYTYVANLLADEFSIVGSADRTKYLEWLGMDNDGINRIDTSIIEKLDVNVYGNAAIVTALHSFKVKASRERFPTDKFWFMTVWIKTDGKWKCVKATVNAVEKNNQAASNNSFNASEIRLIFIGNLSLPPLIPAALIRELGRFA
jgi:ketosteroid isomerase-like protein